MISLNLVLLAGGHPVVPQVVEAKLRCRSVGDVALVHVSPFSSDGMLFWMHPTGEAQGIRRALPSSVNPSARRIIIHRDELAVLTAQSVQSKAGRWRPEVFAFARLPFPQYACRAGPSLRSIGRRSEPSPNRCGWSADRNRFAAHIRRAAVLDHGRKGLGEHGTLERFPLLESLHKFRRLRL